MLRKVAVQTAELWGWRSFSVEIRIQAEWLTNLSRQADPRVVNRAGAGAPSGP
jgi:hypothetical protein